MSNHLFTSSFNDSKIHRFKTLIHPYVQSFSYKFIPPLFFICFFTLRAILYADNEINITSYSPTEKSLNISKNNLQRNN